MQKNALRGGAPHSVYLRRLVKQKLLTKTLLVMKLTTLLLTVALVQAHAAGMAQTVTLSKKEISLKEMFAAIKQQTGYVVFYSRNLLAEGKPVSVSASNMPLEQFLTMALKEQPFTFRIEDKTISLIHKPGVSNSYAEVYEALPQAAPDNSNEVKGRITDTAGYPLAGVTVAVRGRNKTVTTDMKGLFTIEAAPGEVLVLTYIGHETLNYTIVNGIANVQLKMMPKIDNLSDIVIEVNTGYQILQKSNFIGSAATVSGKSLYLNGVNTLEQALQGKLAGVVIQNTSGLTGVRQKTTVRGVSTLSGSQEPVWVVDGIIQQDPLPFKAQELNTAGGVNKDNFDYIRNFVGNAINWLNPNDIEDITVLKDAAATAIYGVKAANGVIVISTKRGKSGPATISYNTSFSVTDRVNYRKLNLMSSKERVAVSREIYNRGLIANSVSNQIGYAGALNDYLYNKTITAEQFNARVAAMESQNTDWFDLMFRKPFSTNHTVSISGGSFNTSYYTSIGYNSSNGTAVGNASKGYTANVAVMSRVSSKFTLSSRVSASYKKTDGFYQFDANDYATNINRVLPAYNADGSLYFYKGPRGYLYNAINERNNTGNANKALSANAVVEGTYEIIPGLRLQTLFSYNSISTNGESYATERSEYVGATLRFSDYGTVKATDATYTNSRLPVGGELNSLTSASNAWNWRNSLSYSKVFAQKHVMVLMFGQEMQSSRYNGFTVTQYGYLRDRGKSFATLPPNTVAYGTSTANSLLSASAPKITDNLSNNLGVYLTGSYSYDNRYVFNASIRTDRSNRFGQFTNEKFNPVYAGGLRWNIANEKWFQKTYWLSTLSARASVGYQRNVASGVSPDLIVKISTSGSGATAVDSYTGDNLLSITTLPYGDLRWEQNLSVNLGLDLSLFNNKVQVSAEYYTKRGKDMITSLNVPVEYGVTSMLVNGGSMNNSGYEVTASFVPVRTKSFTWSVSVNTSKNTNVVKKVGATPLYSYQTAVAGSLYKEGIPVSGFYAFKYTGINPANGNPVIDLTYKAGADVANDPTTYMKYMGKMDPDFTSGLGMNFRYKMFTLASSFYLQMGGKKFLAPLYKATNDLPSEYQNLSRNILDRWSPTNTNSTVPGMPDKSLANVLLPNARTYVPLYEMYNYSTDRVVSASSFRCNNINLTYMFDGKLARRLMCKTINIGAGVANIFSINSSGFRGIDPEVATGGQPRTRTYTCNLSVSF